MGGYHNFEMKMKSSNLEFNREALSKIITDFTKIKDTLDLQQRHYIENRIKVFKTILKHPKTDVYSDENGDTQIGKILHDRCLYCQDDLRLIRGAIYPGNPKKAERYCSKSCMVQHSKMEAKIEKFEADRVTWGEAFVRLIFDQKCDNTNRKKPHAPFTIDLPTRKTRSKNFKG